MTRGIATLKTAADRGSSIPFQNIINLASIEHKYGLENGIFFWVQNEHDIEKLCLACGSPLSSRVQTFCGDRCDSYHFSHKGGWIYRSTEQPGLGKKSRFLHNMLKYFEGSSSHLFYETLKLVGFLISRALSSLEFKQSHSFGHCLINSFDKFFEMFYHPVLESDLKNFSVHESVSESYSLIYAALCYEQFPPLDILCCRSGSSEKFLELYISEVKSFFSLSRWVKCLQIMDCFGLNIYVESEFLKFTQKLPTLQSFTDRREALSKYNDFLLPAEQFLRQNGGFDGRITFPIGEFESNDEMIKIDRAISRIAQAAELANKGNSLFANNRSANCGVSNPFDGYGYVLSILSPIIVPPFYRSQEKDNSLDNSSYVRLEQSCLENVHVEIAFAKDFVVENFKLNEKTCALRLQFIANNHIDATTTLKYNYSKFAEFSTGKAILGKATLVSCEFQDNFHEYSIPCSCMKCSISSDLKGALKDMGVDDELVSSLLAISVSNPRSKRKVAALFENKSNTPTDADFECSLNCISRTKVVDLVLRDLADKISRNLMLDQPRCVSVERCVKLQNLTLVANSYMLQQKVGIATVLYSLIILQVLRDSYTLSARLQGDGWIGDVCLSLGYIGFESLLSSYADAGAQNLLPADGEEKSPWSINLITQIYQIGAKLSPNHTKISDTVKKMNCYSILQTVDDQSHESKQFLFECIIPQKIYMSSVSVLSEEECVNLISAAEHFAAQRNAGWSTSRHYTVPTTDIPLHYLPPPLCSWFLEEVMVHRLSPLLKKQFFPAPKIQKLQIFMNDCFVVKYSVAKDGPSQRYLPLHSDQSTHSLTIALNDDKEYIGGGTFFAELNDVVRPRKGHVSSFRGDLLHGGDSILSGTRYIIALFMIIIPVLKDADPNEANEHPHLNENLETFATNDEKIDHDVNADKKEFSFRFF